MKKIIFIHVIIFSFISCKREKVNSDLSGNSKDYFISKECALAKVKHFDIGNWMVA